MASYDFDVIVVGSGAGGSIAAQQIASSGKTVALIESDRLGGSLAHSSTIPKLALIQAARTFESGKRGAKFGLRGVGVGYNYPSVKRWKDSVVKQTSGHLTPKHYGSKGITVVTGKAYFIDKHTISIGKARLRAKKFVIATGAQHVVPTIPGLASSGFLTAEDATNLLRPPKSLAILGSGAHALEFAQLFATFGTRVTVLSLGHELLAGEEPEAVALLTKELKKQYKVQIVPDAKVHLVRGTGLKKKLTLERSGKTADLTVDQVLVVTEQYASIDIGLENAGVKYEHTGIHVNRNLQTTAKHIFAIGDCVDAPHYGHVAAYHGQVAAHNIVHPKHFTTAHAALPRVVHTLPELAAVGATEAELKEQNISYKSVTLPASLVIKSATSAADAGFIKLLASTHTNLILGATLLHPDAGDAINELSIAVTNHLTTEQLAHSVHTFGSWSELIRAGAAKLSKA